MQEEGKRVKDRKENTQEREITKINNFQATERKEIQLNF